MPLCAYLHVGPRCHCSGLFPMNPELQRIYDSMPEDEPRSRLDPYRELILRWRRQGRTYRRILQMLRDECRVKVAFGTLHEFVQKRSRRRKVQPDLEMESATVQPVESSSAAVSPVELKSRLSPEERAAARAALRASYDQPLFPSEEKKPLFVRRPGPIRNLNNDKQGEK